MDNSLILALIGSMTSLLVAAIGFFATVRVAKIAAERETSRAFALKRHDAILEAAKILLDRANLYQQMLQVADVVLDLCPCGCSSRHQRWRGRRCRRRVRRDEERRPLDRRRRESCKDD